VSLHCIILILIGPPGAGKGTIARLCTEQPGWVQLSTGDLCRQHIAQGTEFGREMDLVLKSGKLVSDDLIVGMVEDWLKNNAEKYQGIIFDGFPRTAAQAKRLKEILANPLFARCGVSVIEMQVPDDAVVERLLSRLVCSNVSCQAIYSAKDFKVGQECPLCSSPLKQRADDSEEAIRKRLSIYHGHAKSLIESCKENEWLVSDLPANQSIEKVYEDFMHLVKKP